MKVYMEIALRDGHYTLITDQELAEQFIEEWEQVDDAKTLEIQGHTDKFSPKPIKITVDKQEVKGVSYEPY